MDIALGAVVFHMRKSHNRPRTEQDFESLCLKLLRAHWKCPELELYATRGQAQHGVDIVDLSGREPLRAAQCRLHEEGRVTTPAEIQDEIEKARGFEPPLERYVVMTTGKVRKEVHDLLIKINREHRRKNSFVVEVFDWRRIEELLDEYTDIRDWYEGGPSVAALGRIESQIDNLSGKIGRITEPNDRDDRADGFHADIDEAKGFLDKHEYQIAKLLLRRIQIRSWDKLSPRAKFRVLTNLAVAESSTDNPKCAAELCLEAKEFQPTDEVARINEAFSHLILGERERAFKLADELRKEFPRSARAMEAFIRSAPDSTSLKSLEESVPRNLFQKDEVVVALTYRALDSDDLQKAEDFVRAATDRGCHASTPWLLLGQIVLRSEVLRSYQRHGNDASACDLSRLREAEDAFGRALSRATEERSSAETIEALLSRCRTRFLLNKNTEARDDVEEARRVAPDNPTVIETYGESLRIEGHADDAIDFMCRVPREELSDHGRLTLGALLVERGRSEDYLNAGALLSQVAKTAATLPEDFREHALDLGLEAFAGQRRLEAGQQLLKEVPSGTISDVAFKTLTARFHFLEGHQEDASRCADEALAVTKDATPASDIRRLARLLWVLGRFNDALPLLQRIYIPGVLSDDTRLLLEIASRLNRHAIMLDVFEKLRESGAIDRTLLDSELSLLQLYDTDAAIRVLEEEISRRPDDADLKLERSLMGMALDRADLVDPDSSNVPRSDEVAPQTALKAIQVLRKLGHEQHAIQYAYEVIRRNFKDSEAHRVFIQALMPFPTEPQVEQLDSVQTGAAVCYVEQHGGSDARWIIVEDSPDAASQFPESELPADHEICKAMMGKKAGDTFLLAKGIQDRIGRITSVQNKYVYRFQDCVGQWQVRFPDLPHLQMVMITQETGESGETELDIEVIKRSVDKRHEHVTMLHQIYKTRPLTLHMFGEQFGTNAFEALRHLATTEDVPVKCSIGSSEEREHTAKALRSCNTVILDMSAISSLFLLERLEILEHWAVDLVVSQGTVNEICQMIADESWFRSGKSGLIIKTETGIAIWEATEEQKRAYVKKLRHLVKVLEGTCKVEPCRSLAAMLPEKRETLVKGFGHYGAESILLSAVPGALLWTDDQAQALLARSEYGVSRVWTQFVIGACVDSSTVDPEAFLDASAKLLGFDYRFTSASPQIIRQAGVIAHWKIDAWPLAQALSVFGMESVDLEQVLQLAGGFLKLLYQESFLPESKAIVTVGVLENIAKRNGGIQGIEVLQRVLPKILGVNVVGLADAARTIDGWLKAADDRLRGPIAFG